MNASSGNSFVFWCKRKSPFKKKHGLLNKFIVAVHECMYYQLNQQHSAVVKINEKTQSPFA